MQGPDDIPPAAAPNSGDTVLIQIYDTPQSVSVVQGKPPNSAIIVDKESPDLGLQTTKLVNYNMVDLTSDVEEVEEEEEDELVVAGGDKTVLPAVMRVTPLQHSPPPNTDVIVHHNIALPSIESSVTNDTIPLNISGIVPMVNDISSPQFYLNIYDIFSHFRIKVTTIVMMDISVDFPLHHHQHLLQGPVVVQGHQAPLNWFE